MPPFERHPHAVSPVRPSNEELQSQCSGGDAGLGERHQRRVAGLGMPPCAIPGTQLLEELERPKAP